MPPAEAVHETRKAIKRLRALMRLLEGELGTKRAARERAALGATADRLAGARDAEVMVATLAGVLARAPRGLSRKRGVVRLQARLERARGEAVARLAGGESARERAAEELVAIRARVAGWDLRDRSARRLAGPGLERIVRAGRRGRRRAAKGKRATRGRSGAKGKRAAAEGARARHRWRKHVKDLRYALEALSVREPGGGPPAGRLAKLARRADRLGETLGEEHDLVLLAELVRADRRLKRKHGRTRRRLLRAIERRRAKLTKRALREGERLYGRGPGRFARAVRA